MRRVPAAASAAAAIGFLVSGCAYSLSEFAQERQPPPPVATAAAAPTDTTGAPISLLEPAALVDDRPLPPPPQAASVAATTGSLAPARPPPAQTDSKLLTAEEKARVIAELEALARSQKVSAPPVRPQTKCQDETLDAAERLRREVEGIAC